MSDVQLRLPQDWRAWTWQGGDSPLALQQRYISAQPLQPHDVMVQNAAIGLNPVD